MERFRQRLAKQQNYKMEYVRLSAKISCEPVGWTEKCVECG